MINANTAIRVAQRAIKSADVKSVGAEDSGMVSSATATTTGSSGQRARQELGSHSGQTGTSQNAGQQGQAPITNDGNQLVLAALKSSLTLSLRSPTV